MRRRKVREKKRQFQQLRLEIKQKAIPGSRNRASMLPLTSTFLGRK
jgi:hypothetical protein